MEVHGIVFRLQKSGVRSLNAVALANRLVVDGLRRDDRG